jgi:hypothetical protein
VSVQDRNNAIQGEWVRLYHTFVYNGTLYWWSDPGTNATVDIVAEDGTTLASSIKSSEDRIGYYYVDWLVPKNLPPGKYYDRWTYTMGTDPSKQVTSYFQVYAADQWMVFGGSTTSSAMSDRVTTLVRSLEYDFIYEAMHIPLHWEQGLRTPDPTRFSFAYKNWRQDPKPLVRKNGQLLDAGWMPDYQGQIFFTEPQDPTDDISASYTFSYFGRDELAGFLVEGMRALNAIPPVTSYYSSVNAAPAFWDYGMLLMAAIHALRRIVMGMNFQERAIIFGEDPEKVSAARQSFQQLYTDYSTLWMELSKGIKKALPPSGIISIPEYTLPGGRARWFRYLYASPVS